MITHSLRKQASKLVLGIALATGTAMVVGHAIPDAAHAQRKKDKKEKEAKAPEAQYSKEFVAAYSPVNDALNAEGADAAALRPQIDALIPLAVSPDERNALGGLVYNAGMKSSDRALQAQGIDLMLASGKTAPENIGRFNFIGYQQATALNDFAKARQYLQSAIDAGFTTDTISTSDLQISMAESYFSAEDYAAGLDYLDKAIKARKAQGLPVDEAWYRRGITVSYNNQIVPQVYDMSLAWVADYPSAKNWRDAVNLVRNLNDYEGAEILDLLRLSRKVDALDEKNDYLFYVEAADPRRLPKEVKDVIDYGYAKGVISRDDSYVAESLSTANSRIAADRADLPALERDAMAGNAALRTVVAAGGAFLSYGDYDKAVTLYQKALTMPGVDMGETLTRLGIAQIGLGNYAAAEETLSKVSGTRLPIAKLWAAYARQQSSGTAMAATGA